jgi:hypothetical protein
VTAATIWQRQQQRRRRRRCGRSSRSSSNSSNSSNSSSSSSSSDSDSDSGSTSGSGQRLPVWVAAFFFGRLAACVAPLLLKAAAAVGFGSERGSCHDLQGRRPCHFGPR